MEKELKKPVHEEEDSNVNIYGGDWCDGNNCGLEW